jgi:hypothetical protein
MTSVRNNWAEHCICSIARAAYGPHLGRKKGTRSRRHFCQQITDNRFGPAVHRRAVDHPPAGSEQQL